MRRLVAAGGERKSRVLRRLLVVGGILLLLVAGWGGLVLIGWRLPRLGSGSVAFHGPLMVGGFLGTLLSLERAVALRRGWAFAAPALAAASGAALLFGSAAAGEALQAAAGLTLVVVFVAMIRRQPSLFTMAMGLGAVAWVAATMLWAAGQRMALVVPWWTGFLVLTIVAERLELSRFLKPGPGKTLVFLSATGLYLAGLLLTLRWPGPGWGTAGAGMLAMTIWLLAYDLAMRTVRQRGVTRYVAVCLLSGYFWLMAAGGLTLVAFFARIGPYATAVSCLGPFVADGALYDAILHAVLVGFVFSMIFGHAPIIFPSVLAVRMDYRPRFYAHLALLELSVALRVASDIAPMPLLHRWAGLLNGIAIVLFLIQTVSSVSLAGSERPQPVRAAATVRLSPAPHRQLP